MFELFRTLSLRYITRHYARAALVVLSIALGVASWVASETVYGALTDSVHNAASPLRGSADFSVTNTATLVVDARLADDLRKLPGADRVEPIILESVKVDAGHEEKADAMLIGVEVPRSEREGAALGRREIEVLELDADALADALRADRLVEWVRPAMARPFVRARTPVPVLVGEQLAADVLGGKKEFKLEGRDGRRRPAVVVGRVRAEGRAAAIGARAVICPWEPAAVLLGKPGKVNRLDVFLKPDADRPAALKQARALLEGQAKVQTADEQDDRIRQVMKGFKSGFRFSGAGALIVGLFLVYNAMSVSVAERRHDIGILRSTGSTRAQVRSLFVAEALVMGVVGALVGSPLGLLIAHASLGPVQSLVSGVFLELPPAQVAADWPLLLGAGGAGIATALLAALVPASRAAAEEPADAVRRAPPGPGLPYHLLQAGASVTLCTVGVLLVLGRPYLTPGVVAVSSLGLAGVGLALGAGGYFLLVSRNPGPEDSPGARRAVLALVCGAVLLGVGLTGLLLRETLASDWAGYGAFLLVFLGFLLMAPQLGAFVTRLTQRALRPVLPVASRLALDNLVRSPGRTGLVVAALAAGVALMVQTAGMIESNESAYRDWIDDSIKADLYLTSGGASNSAAQLRALPDSSRDELKDQLPAGSRLVGHTYRYPEWDPGSGREKTLIFMTLLDAAEHVAAGDDRESYAALARWRRVAEQPGVAISFENFPTLVLTSVLDAAEHTAARGRTPDPALDRWRRLAEKPGGAIVSENFALMHGVKEGDPIHLEGSRGVVTFTVVGTVVDYNWIRGSIFVDRVAHRDDFDAAAVNAWATYLPKGSRGDLDAVRRKLANTDVTARHQLLAFTREEVRDEYLRAVYGLYGLAYTQEVVVGIVVVMGVVTALLISVLSRRRELGLLRAVGATRSQVLHTVLAEAVLISFVGSLLGIAIGLPLEWYAVRVVFFEEAGFLFPMRVPWAQTGFIAALAVVVATLAGLAPAVYAGRLRIVDAIAYE